MNEQQRNRFRTQLTQFADRVGRTAAALEEGVRTPLGGETGGGISNAPMHMGDLGTETYTQELDATLLENETYIRDEALAALNRLDAGTFGRCERCDKDIGTPRLEALPYARYCVVCADAVQSGRAVNLNEGRPESWLGEPGHEGLAQTGSPPRVLGRDLGAGPDDIHAAGTPGGGTEVGGLAGTNIGSGAPDGANLEQAMGGGVLDADAEDDEDELPAEGGASGGAVGGTPANKRATGKAARTKTAGKAAPKKAPRSKPQKDAAPKSSARRTKKSKE